MSLPWLLSHRIIALRTRWPNPIETTVNVPGQTNLLFHLCGNEGVFKSDNSRPPQATLGKTIILTLNTFPATLPHVLLESFNFTQRIARQVSHIGIINDIHNGFSNCCCKRWRGLHDPDLPWSIFSDFEGHCAPWPHWLCHQWFP